ncbi:diguanylate cyclase [Trichothermofontia sp.]
MDRAFLEFQAELAALRQTYAAQILDKCDQIETVWQRVLRQQHQAYTTLYQLAHRMRGSGSTFGFLDLSRVAQQLEELFRHLSDVGTATPEQVEQVNHLLAELKAIARQFAAEDAGQKTPLDTRSPATNQSDTFGHEFIQRLFQTGAMPRPTAPLYPGSSKLIFLLEPDPQMAQDLSTQVSFFGYKVQTFASFSALETAIQETLPDALILDVALSEVPELEAGPNGTAHILPGRLLANVPAHPPLLFIADREDMADRLKAVRAGGDAYFTKPVPVSTLVDQLDRLTAVTTAEPYRILVVDDEPEQAEYYAHVLETAGMLSRVVTDPMQVMQALSEWETDLILMDMHMPGCTGLELAAVIRQQPIYVSTPIVFLSIETDLDQHRAALHQGGDQFLVKPIPPTDLVIEVLGRVHRSRILRSLMERDSLTGLLKHTTIKEQLQLEIKRAQRQRSLLAFAMLDIDHFKQINDTYGHATGDQVLRSLARMLQQRLRRTDAIGRYGGEEFAIILPDTSGDAALKVLNEIREGFAHVQHQGRHTATNASCEFTVTFSCGIATFPTYTEAASLSDAADRALYQAKRRGRNQVVLATPFLFPPVHGVFPPF